MTSPAAGPRRPPAKERLRLLWEEYGTVGVVVFAVLWVGTLGVIYTAVKLGWRPESAAGEAGTFGMAYVIFRFTLPVRIGATLVLTPLVAKVLEKFGWRKPAPKR